MSDRDQHADPRWWDDTDEAYDLRYKHGTAVAGMQSLPRAAAKGDQSARDWLAGAMAGDSESVAALFGISLEDVGQFKRTQDYDFLVRAISMGGDHKFWLGE